MTKIHCPVGVDGRSEHAVKRAVRDCPVHIDRCMVDVVDALNVAGIRTDASCCGHGMMPGWVALKDGRYVFVSEGYEDGFNMLMQLRQINGISCRENRK